MQHVAKISCRNGVEGEYWEEKGKSKREKCNMLQKYLAEMVSCWKYAEIFIWKS